MEIRSSTTPALSTFGPRQSNQSESDTRTPQARSLERLNELDQARQQQFQKKTEAAEPATDSVRISSTVGAARQALGLTAKEALALYKSIERMM